MIPIEHGMGIGILRCDNILVLLLLPETAAARVSTDGFGRIYKGGDQPLRIKSRFWQRAAK
jgi:hypothetical protein